LEALDRLIEEFEPHGSSHQDPRVTHFLTGLKEIVYGNSVLSMKSVDEIAALQMKFFIPSYQRGYRWEKDQVDALLDDLEEFAAENGPQGFYCLQPLVVVKREDEWEVVDGQQRLTTLFLILRQLHAMDHSPFQIRYERHPKNTDGLSGLLEKLLVDPLDPDLRSPDFHYLSVAHKTITQWFLDHPDHHLSLLGRDSGPSVKFIWYQLEHKDAITAFSRLNAGKIRLTDAELIRALFLRSGGLEETERLKIAMRWDQMERRFQEPEFWGFLTPKGYSPANHIELLFQQFSKRHGWAETAERALYDQFYIEFKADKDGAIRRAYWEELETIFSVFEEWFEENDLFHLVGFLINNKAPLSSLVTPALDRATDKAAFHAYLKAEVRKKVLPDAILTAAGIEEDLKELKYDEKNGAARIRIVLLCLNLATLVNDQTGTVRFSFDAYKHDEWDIEHIRATASRAPTGSKELTAALDVIHAYIKTRKDHPAYRGLLEKLKTLAAGNQSEDRLAALYQECIGHLENFDELEPTNDISNLTLLDAGTNRGYGNSPFQVKRDWVLGLEQQAKYLLPSTRNVFTKSYTLAPTELLHWSQNDADDYLSAVCKILAQFFGETTEESSC
jgi:hypothetical protein